MRRFFSYFCLIGLSVTSGLFLTDCRNGNATGRSFYVSPSGNDDNDGTLLSPLRTIERVNRMILSHGDTILFEGGAIFNGTFRIDSIDSGDESGYVVIGSYGSGKAILDGGNKEGIIADNAEYFKILNLLVRGKGRKTGNSTDGIYISTSENFSLDNLEVFGFQHSGINILGSKNARITKILSHDNGFAGISAGGKHLNHPDLYDNYNLFISNCKAYNNPGDPTILNNHSGSGILAASVNGGTIEYCEAFNNGWDMPWTGNGPVGIWIWDCNNVTIQYCMSHDNKTNPVAADGGGFDLDGGVSNSLIQYCLSWSNQGPGFGLFEFGASKVWENNVIRYNISRNDGIRNGGSLSVWKGENGGTMRNCAIYNNTFYNDTARGISVWFTTAVKGFTFANNIFLYKGSFLGNKQVLSSDDFSGNCVFHLSGNGSGVSPKPRFGTFIDPKMEDPRRKIVNDPKLLNESNLGGFTINESALKGSGIDPGSPFGFANSYIGITGSSLKNENKIEIGAAGLGGKREMRSER